jgi:hypothetical protein
MLRAVVNPEVVIPIMGMLTGLVSIVVIGTVFVRVAQSAIGQALARRIQGKHGPGDEELRGEMDELREQVIALEHRLAESEERLDFTERLLTHGKEPERLAEGGVVDNRH